MPTTKHLLVLILFLLANYAFSQTGVLSGKVVDGKTGETIMGSTVVVDDNPELAAQTDLDGNFTISKVPAGKHKVKLRYVGYQEKQQEVSINANEVTTFNATLLEDAVVLKEAVVTATVTRRDNESAIVMMQKNSTVIQSGISSEEMKRSPDRSSGDVIRRVSGATIQDGKFAIIRGLADRYNMALLNNVILPSTEPDRKAFAFDVFPSNILENIVIMKTAQPNLPSEWAGGLIQLNTRDVPEKNFFNVTYGISFNEGSTFKPYQTYEGSKTDFLGFDSKVRPLPQNFPGLIELNDLKLASRKDSLRTLGKSITNTSWNTKEKKTAYPGQSIQISGGFAVRKKDIQIGGVFALSYSNSLRYTEGDRAKFLQGNEYDSRYFDERYNNTVAAALLGNLSVVIKNNHKISWKNIFTNNSDNSIIQRDGVTYGGSTEQQRTSLEFVTAKVFTTNLSGDHLFKGSDIRWRWNGGYVMINRDQPRTTRYSYERAYTSSTPFGENETTDSFRFQFSQGGSDPKQGAYFYSKLGEKVYSAGTDLTIPFKISNQKQSISVGYLFQHRTRSFSAQNMFIDKSGSGIGDSVLYSRDVDQIINQANFDNKSLTMNPLAFPGDIYNAKSTTHAAYIMMENNIAERVKIIWGARFETFTQALTTPDKLTFERVTLPTGERVTKTKVIDTTYTKQYFSGAYNTDSSGKVTPVFPLLPSANFIFKLTETMNLRASYSQTMSRPEFRETARFNYFDFLRDASMAGNPNLNQTFIHNADLRFEYFMGKGQSLNASVFYKNFKNTIELTSLASSGAQSFVYNNAQSAYLVGLEVEVRKNFDFVSKKLEDLVFVANMAYIYSHVDLRNVQNNSSDEQVRPMQGQSPYVINLGLSYVHPKIGTGVTVLYNQVGPRLYATGEVGNPSWYENWRPLLDLQISQKFLKGRGIVRFTISDLVAAKSIFYQNNEIGKHRDYQKGKDNVVLSQSNYRNYTLQVGFNF